MSLNDYMIQIPPRSSGSFIHRVSNHRGSISDMRNSDGLSIKVEQEFVRTLSGRASFRKETPQPVIFTKEGSVGSNTNLSISYSNTGEEEANAQINVAFSNIDFMVKSELMENGRSRAIKKRVFRDFSGRCSWGKLTAVMGPSGSGKSSLLKILAGIVSRENAEVTGEVTYNNVPIDLKIQPWERCAYVESGEPALIRDLSVRDVVTFAMYLRCKSKNAVAMVEENVNRTLTILNLLDVANKTTKSLSPGQLRVVSIAEEVVSGSPLLFVDEPLTDLSVKEQSIVMNTFREMVNQGRTVVASFHEPSNEVFELCDHLHLLGKEFGR